MTFEKTTPQLGFIKYTFTFGGYEGACFIENDGGDFLNASTIIVFPEGKYRFFTQVSNQMLNDHESDAINALAEMCRSSYEKAIRSMPLPE